MIINAEDILKIGASIIDDPGSKADPRVADRQDIINITEVLKMIALILLEIRDGKKAYLPIDVSARG